MWSFGTHSLNMNAPLATGGALFSGASSRFLLASLGSRYLPKTLLGMMLRPPIWLSAGQNALTSVTVMVLPSTLMPDRSSAPPLMYSLAPTIWSTLFLWLVFLLRSV